MTSELEKALKTMLAPGFGDSKPRKPRQKPSVSPEAVSLLDPTVLARTLRQIGYGSWGLALTAGHAKLGQREFERMREPRPGDLVIELTTIHDNARDLQAVGILLRQVREPVVGEDGNAVAGQTELAFYIQNLAGEEVRWHNCQFIALQVWGRVDG